MLMRRATPDDGTPLMRDTLARDPDTLTATTGFDAPTTGHRHFAAMSTTR